MLPGTGEVVAHSLERLRSGQLVTAIHVTETGEDIGAPPAEPCLESAFRVWTGTDSSGAAVWNATCSNWDTQETRPAAATATCRSASAARSSAAVRR